MVDPQSARSADGCKALYDGASEFIESHKDSIKGIIYKTRFGGMYGYKDFKFTLYDFENAPFTDEMNRFVDDAIAYFQPIADSGLPVVWLGTNSELSLDFRQILSQSESLEAALKTARGKIKSAEIKAIDEALYQRLQGSSIRYISEEQICQGPCPQLTDTGAIIVPDFGHWGAQATPYMGQVLLLSPAFRQALPIFEPAK